MAHQASQLKKCSERKYALHALRRQIAYMRPKPPRTRNKHQRFLDNNLFGNNSAWSSDAGVSVLEIDNVAPNRRKLLDNLHDSPA